MRVSAALLLCLTAAAQLWANPEVSFEGPHVLADQVTPGSSAVFFGVSRHRPRWNTVITSHRELALDERSTGSARYTVDMDEVPGLSVWAVVDLATGGLTLAMPGDRLVTEKPFPEVYVGAKETPEGYVAPQGGLLEALLVRPGVGAWAYSAGDGGINDQDGLCNSSIQLQFASMAPIGSSGPAPECAVSGDIVVLVNAYNLVVQHTVVGGDL